MYFQNFPKVEYDVNGDGIKNTITDITRRVRMKDTSLLNSVNFDFYDVPDGATPESVAYDVYGDAEYHWIVLIANNIRDVYTDWPMSVNRFEEFVKSKYDNVDDIHHYEIYQESGDTTVTIELPNDPATSIPIDATAITNYQYEETELEKKRRIKIVRLEFVEQIVEEFRNVIGK